jgi:hypothetical protein
LNLRFEAVDLVSQDLEAPDIEAQSADLYTLNHDAKLQAARKPLIDQLIDGFDAFNRSFYQEDDQDIGNCSGALSLLWVHVQIGKYFRNYTKFTENANGDVV